MLDRGLFLARNSAVLTRGTRGQRREVGLAMRSTQGLMLMAMVVAGCGAPARLTPNDKPKLWTPSALTTSAYEASPSFSPDGREMVFMRADRAFYNYELLQSQCERGGWSTPHRAPFSLPLPVMDADPFISIDGRRLYFVSTRAERDGVRSDFDIWVVERASDSTWGKLAHLPAPVNSDGSELLPRELPDGRLLFGSDRAGGLGKSDIYIAERSAGGSWRVENLGPPVNSSANEFEAEISRDLKTLIVVADVTGRSHLYRFVREGAKWVSTGSISAYADVFQVGPILSPSGDRLLFAQADPERSGEIYIVDLADKPDPGWPPRCVSKGKASYSP